MELPGGSGQNRPLQQGGRDAVGQVPSPHRHCFSPSIPSALQVLVPSCHQAGACRALSPSGRSVPEGAACVGARAVRARGEGGWQGSLEVEGGQGMPGP